MARILPKADIAPVCFPAASFPLLLILHVSPQNHLPPGTLCKGVRASGAAEFRLAVDEDYRHCHGPLSGRSSSIHGRDGAEKDSGSGCLGRRGPFQNTEFRHSFPELTRPPFPIVLFDFRAAAFGVPFTLVIHGFLLYGWC